MTTAEAQAVSDSLSEMPARIRGLVQKLSAREARWKQGPKEFSTLEHVCHLNDLEREGYAVRIERLMQEEHPLLPDFDGGRIAAERDYQHQELNAVLAAFADARASNMRAVGRLSAEDLQRGGTLEIVGPITLGELLLKMREHDEEHLQELRALREQLRRRSPHRRSKASVERDTPLD